ncbi:hypothetical protein A3C99_01110 [Candidatus Daviesbacteria bacterium RIFCSPHIGHO2_02_FULL_37_9]|nr:MAG: hypothetical protein A3C99_01110 [Candidatus Daviesbacteria bacterium RIFCSPHIGHO2_02_FULL_37_9]
MPFVEIINPNSLSVSPVFLSTSSHSSYPKTSPGIRISELGKTLSLWVKSINSGLRSKISLSVSCESIG